MTFYKFEQNDLFFNRIKTYPSVQFSIYAGDIIYNNESGYTGDASGINVKMVPSGTISLYEINIDRAAGQLVYPFVVKGGDRICFKNISKTDFNANYLYGDNITGSYPLSSSISSDRFGAGVNGSSALYYRDALRNALDSYSKYSPSFLFSSSLGNKNEQELRIISIPSIFFGSSIKRGSCCLKFYASGSLISELRDDTRTGELRQVSSGSGADSGSVAGVVLYDHGFVLITGSWDLTSSFSDNYGRGSSTAPRWTDFAFTGSTATYSSFDMSFSGTNFVPTRTMLAHLPKGHLNNSNNPTFVKHGQTYAFSPSTGSNHYHENSEINIKNISRSNFLSPTASFEKTTYINKVGIFDKDRNLIAVAKLATPVRKRENEDLTIKLKLDF